MDVLSIKIKIGNRIYPMKVNVLDEAFVRAASKQLEAQISHYQKRLKIQDQQDLLAMVAFDCLVEMLKKQEQQAQWVKHIEQWGVSIKEALEES